MTNIFLLGATGSIGDSVLSVIKQNSDRLNLKGITFHSNITKAKQIVEDFNPSYIYSDANENLKNLRSLLNNSYEVEIMSEKSELENLLNNKNIDFGKTSYPPTKEMLTQEFWDEQSKKDAREMNRQNFLDFAFEYGKIVIIDMHDNIMDKTEEKWFE